MRAQERYSLASCAENHTHFGLLVVLFCLDYCTCGGRGGRVIGIGTASICNPNSRIDHCPLRTALCGWSVKYVPRHCRRRRTPLPPPPPPLPPPSPLPLLPPPPLPLLPPPPPPPPGCARLAPQSRWKVIPMSRTAAHASTSAMGLSKRQSTAALPPPAKQPSRCPRATSTPASTPGSSCTESAASEPTSTSAQQPPRAPVEAKVVVAVVAAAVVVVVVVEADRASVGGGGPSTRRARRLVGLASFLLLL